MTRLALSSLPFWPRHLTREEAARYVGVSVDVFDDEVAAGEWPPPRRRGSKGGRLTWDREALDLVSNASLPSATGRAEPALMPNADEQWRKGLNAEAAGRRDQDRPADAGGRNGKRAPLRTKAA